MYVGDINGFQPIQKSDRAMTYLNSRSVLLDDDISAFSRLGLIQTSEIIEYRKLLRIQTNFGGKWVQM